MTHEGHGPDPPAPSESHAGPFTNAEIASMHDEDRKAAGTIVTLMALIFFCGVIGYAVVDYICWHPW